MTRCELGSIGGLVLLVANATVLPGCQTGSGGGGAAVAVDGDEIDTDGGQNEDDAGGAPLDEAWTVSTHDTERACAGTTFFADLHDQQRPRIVEVDMEGIAVWEYVLPEDLKEYINPGLDVEVLDSGNILFVLPGSGMYEIDRAGDVVWSHLDPRVSHDADRLADGNTLYVFGNNDTINDAQAKEVDPTGRVVWSWSARDEYDRAPYAGIARQGWTHANAVTRLDNGNTLVNLRNFGLTTEVNADGEVVDEIDWNAMYEHEAADGLDPHEPEAQTNEAVLVCLQHDTPFQIVEYDRAGGTSVWEYYRERLRTARDSDRLPNGNTLVVGVIAGVDESVIFEVTPDGDIVWELKISDLPATGSPGWFYKAQRICEP